MDMSIYGCCYKTPCGWCAKWDKECDRKIGGRISGAYKDLFKAPKDNPAKLVTPQPLPTKER